MFLEWDWFTTDANAVAHQFYGPRRLGQRVDYSSAEVSEQDAPVLLAPSVGSGALQMQMLAAGAKAQGYYAPQHGFSVGLLRSIVYPAITATTDTGASLWGLYALGSALNLTGGSGTVYFAGCWTFGFESRVVLGSHSSGVAASGFTSLAQSPIHQWLYETRLTMQLRWSALPGALVLEYWQGSATDYSDLALVLQVSQAVTLGYTPVAEGLFCCSGGVCNVYCDETSLYAVV